MGLEVRRILARANGSFQSRKMKKSTLGMSSKRSQYRTLADGYRNQPTGKVLSATPQPCPPTHTYLRTHARTHGGDPLRATACLTWRFRYPHRAAADSDAAR